jgi:imidazolonepropionase-like amidohydrolase
MSIEHANLIEPDTARRVRDEGAIVCPTLITFDALKREGSQHGLGPDSVAKIDDVRLRGMQSLEIMQEAGVTMAYGSDLLGPMHRHQSDEFVLRREVLPAIEVIRAATINAARLLRMEGKIGVVAAGAMADLIVVDGDPLKDISLLTRQGAHLMMIMKGGQAVKSELN